MDLHQIFIWSKEFSRDFFTGSSFLGNTVDVFGWTGIDLGSWWTMDHIGLGSRSTDWQPRTLLELFHHIRVRDRNTFHQLQYSSKPIACGTIILVQPLSPHLRIDFFRVFWKPNTSIAPSVLFQNICSYPQDSTVSIAKFPFSWKPRFPARGKDCSRCY